MEPALRDVHIELLFNMKHRELVDVRVGRELGEFADSDAEFSDSAAEVSQDLDCEFDDSDLDGRPKATSSTARKQKVRTYKSRSTSRIRAHTFLEKPVCQWALQKLYGIGTSVVEALRKGGRTSRPGDRMEPKHATLGFSMLHKSYCVWPSVLTFLWFLYHSVADGPEHISNVRLAWISPEPEARQKNEKPFWIFG